MNERRATILKLVAESYIETAHPVPSGRVADALDLSSATVRNEFAALEEAGFLHQPHTSAGRMPTANGFHAYAAAFIPPHRLPDEQRIRIRATLHGLHGDRLLQQLAALVAELSGYAVVVSVPADDRLKTHEVHLSLLSGRHLLVVVVLENGLVRQFAVDLDPAPEDDVLDDAERSLRQLTLPAREVPAALRGIASNVTGDLSRTLRAVADAWPSMTPPRLVADGVRNLLGEPEARDPAFLRRVMDQVEAAPDAGAAAPGISLDLDDALALVRTDVELFGLDGSSITLVGPARMRYPQAIMVVSGVREEVSTVGEGSTGWGEA